MEKKKIKRIHILLLYFSSIQLLKYISPYLINLKLFSINIIITMGNTHNLPSNPPHPNPIAHAYLAKVLKGIKQEVNSTVQIQTIANQQIFLGWKKDCQLYQQKIQKTLSISSQAVCSFLLFPVNSRYQISNNLCGDKEGKVVLEFANGLLSLEQSKLLHIQENMPFTASQIWNLLLTMVQLNGIIKKAQLDLDLRPQSIYVDLRTKIIKLRNPYSFLDSSSQKYIHQKYIDTQKLQLLIRKLKISQEIQSQNDDFNIGMMVAQVMLLQTSCMIYDDGLTSHKTINSTLHYLLIQKILTLSYYPLKLRIIVAGLIQLTSKHRFTTKEVYRLLQEDKEKIKAFNTFHLRKTAFQTIFQQKLNNIQTIMGKIKKKTNASLYKERIPMAFTLKENEDKFTKLIPAFKKKTEQIQKAPDQSINLSITHLEQANRHADVQSLMLSKSQIKSSIQQRQSNRDPSFNLTNSVEIKTSPRNIFPQMPKMNKATSNPFEEIVKLSKQQSKPTLPKEILSATNTLQKESKREASQNKQNSLKASQEKQQQALRQLISIQKSELKKQQNQIRQNIVGTDLIFQKKFTTNQSQNINVQKSKHMQDGDISQIQERKDRSHSDRPSRNSSVVQYVSQLYQAERIVQTPSEVTHTQNMAQRQREIQSQQKKYFDSSQHQGLPIRKVDSYEVPPDPSSLMPDSSSSVVISHHMKITHKDSIIDGLTPLVNSKKFIEDSYKPQKLSQTAQKRADYFKTFAKFSPQVIAQLKLPSSYPNQQNLKRSMRETISFSSMIINKTKQMFPQQYSSKERVSPFMYDSNKGGKID